MPKLETNARYHRKQSVYSNKMSEFITNTLHLANVSRNISYRVHRIVSYRGLSVSFQPYPALSVPMSVRQTSVPPALPLHSPQYLTDPVHIWYSHWPFWLWGFCVHFVGSSGTLKFYEHTDWLASWTRPSKCFRPPLLYIFGHFV